MKHSFLFLMLIASLAQFGFSQLKIVKDNINCTYGLKNAEGKWVVPASYILIENMGKEYFKTTNDNGRGILDGNGKIIIPNKYDDIKITSKKIFKVTENEKHGLIDEKNKRIADSKYKEIEFDGHRIILRKFESDTACLSTVIDTLGNILIPETEGYILPFQDREFTLIGKVPYYYKDYHKDPTIGRKNTVISHKVGIIDTQGKLIVSRIYDRIELCPDLIFIKKNEKIGIINRSNYQVILEPKYLIHNDCRGWLNDWRDKCRFCCISRPHLFVIEENGKFGLLQFDGTFKIHPTLDLIISISIYEKTKEASFLFRKNNKMGVLAEDGSVTLDAVYDTLISKRLESKSFFLYKKNEKYGAISKNGVVLNEVVCDTLIPTMVKNELKFLYRNKGKYGMLSENGVVFNEVLCDTLIPTMVKNKLSFLYRKQGKYGLMADNGAVLTEALYDCLITSGNDYFFSKGTEVYYLDISSDKIIAEKATLLGTQDRVYVFKIKGRLFPFSTTIKQPWVISFLCESEIVGGFYIVIDGTNGTGKPYGAGPYPNCIYANMYSDGRGYENWHHKQKIFTLDGKSWKGKNMAYLSHYSIDKTPYALVYTHKENKGLANLYTTQLIIDTLYQEMLVIDNVLWAKDKEWIAFDTTGRKLSEDTFNNYFHFSSDGISIASQKGLQGVIDSRFKWLVQPNYKKIEQISKDCFTVYTQGSKYGIINLKNKLLVDTIYTDYRMICEIFKDGRETWFLLQNKDSRLIVGERSKITIVTTKEGVDEKLLECSLSKENENDRSKFFQIRTINTFQDSLLRASPFKNALYDSIFKIYYSPLVYLKSEAMESLRQAFVKQGKDYTQYHPCNHLRVNNNCYDDQIWSEIISMGDDFVSVRMNDGGWYSGTKYLKHQMFLNFIWEKETLKPVSIPSIFGSMDIFQQELFLAIKARDDLNLDCTSPEQLAKNFAQHFSLSKEGLTCYHKILRRFKCRICSPDDFYETIKIFIPVERLKKHKESAWIVDFLK